MGATGIALWWIALAIFFLVVVPLVVIIAINLVRAAVRIARYADDIHEHAQGIGRALEPVPELLRTKQMLAALTPVRSKGGDPER